MRNKKVLVCKEGKLGQPVLGAGVIDTIAGTALDAFVHHALPYMAKTTVEMGRYYGQKHYAIKSYRKKL